MTGPDPYYGVDLLRASLRSNALVYNEDDYILAVESASRWIDDRCSDYERGLIRKFWRDPAPVTRTFHAVDRRVVDTGDFDILDGEDPPVVEVDAAGNDVWTPVASSAWRPEPRVRAPGFPYTRIVWASYEGGWPLGLTARVRMATRYGWAVLPYPAPVRQTCRLLSVTGMLGTDVMSNEEVIYSGSRGDPVDPFTLAEGFLRPYLQTPALADPAPARR